MLTNLSLKQEACKLASFKVRIMTYGCLHNFEKLDLEKYNIEKQGYCKANE